MITNNNPADQQPPGWAPEVSRQTIGGVVSQGKLQRTAIGVFKVNITDHHGSPRFLRLLFILVPTLGAPSVFGGNRKETNGVHKFHHWM